MAFPRRMALFVLPLLVLAGCERNPLLVRRSACPAVGIPTYAGDTTLFAGNGTPDAANIDVVATITNARQACAETPELLTADISYDIVARRTDAGPARTVVLPVFVSMVQGGNLVVSKQTTSVSLAFAAGAARATARGTARATVARSAATLPPEILARVNRRRKPGELDAATDPMAEPEVRAAMRAASFEVLVGFQLDERQLAYNVAK